MSYQGKFREYLPPDNSALAAIIRGQFDALAASDPIVRYAIESYRELPEVERVMGVAVALAHQKQSLMERELMAALSAKPTEVQP